MADINLFKSSSDAAEMAPGDALFTEGEPGDVMYAVVDGRIEITIDGETVEEVGPGGIVGELALIDASPRAATARAAVASRVVRVDKKHFMFLVQEHPTFALQVMGVMAERLRHANEAHSER